MATFNIDSLDFVDDEEARFGADADFAARFSSANTRLELEDLTNATVGYVPQDVGTDLVGGKFAETVAEGKALADDGNVYDLIQSAENAASSWVKIGPGTFNESVDVNTSGLTIEGVGERTKIESNSGVPINITSSNVTVSSLSAKTIGGSFTPIVSSGSNTTVKNAIVPNGTNHAIEISGSNSVVYNCGTVSTDSYGILVSGQGSIVTNNTCGSQVSRENIRVTAQDVIVSHNTILGSVTDDGIRVAVGADDCIIHANLITDTSDDGIQINGIDNVVSNNRIVNAGGQGVQDSGTGTVLDANLTT